MHELDPGTRRNIEYAALPGKAASALVVLILCLLGGLFATGMAAYLYGVFLRHVAGGH